MRAPGVYAIRNTKSRKVYVGSSVDISRRLTHHRCLLNRRRHWNRHLQLSFDKHGIESFVFEVLELCKVDKLQSREQIWIDKLGSFGRGGYNMTPVAGSTRGRRYSHRDETKVKISMTTKGVPRPKSESHRLAHEKAMAKKRGVPFSDQHRSRISSSKMGHSVNPETRAKISATLKARYTNAK